MLEARTRMWRTALATLMPPILPRTQIFKSGGRFQRFLIQQRPNAAFKIRGAFAISIVTEMAFTMAYRSRSTDGTARVFPTVWPTPSAKLSERVKTEVMRMRYNRILEIAAAQGRA